MMLMQNELAGWYYWRTSDGEDLRPHFKTPQDAQARACPRGCEGLMEWVSVPPGFSGFAGYECRCGRVRESARAQEAPDHE